MKSTFVDSSTFVALVVRKDHNHRAAKRTLKALAKARTPLITAVVSAARGRSHNPRVGLEHFVRYDDQSFSFTDCASFAPIGFHRHSEQVNSLDARQR